MNAVLNRIAIVLMVVTAGLLPLAQAGCTVPGPDKPLNATATALAATMVPAIDLDAYVYVNQQGNTSVPGSILGGTGEIVVQSLALWGVLDSNTQAAVGGALAFAGAADARTVFDRIPKRNDIYTKLTGSTIYFVYGKGTPAQTFKDAVDYNQFVKYSDKAALAEVSRLPLGGTVIPRVVAVIKPNKANVDITTYYLSKHTASLMIDLVKPYLDKNTLATVTYLANYYINDDEAALVKNLYSEIKPNIITLAFLTAKPLDPVEIVQRYQNNTLWEMDLGAVISMDSAYPGFILGPVADRAISSQGYPKVAFGNTSAYKYAPAVNGRTLNIYFNVTGNHLNLAGSVKDAYAQALLSGIAS